MTEPEVGGPLLSPPPFEPANRGERFAFRLIQHLPRGIAAAPERVLINVACVLIGFAVLMAGHHSTSLASHWPSWLASEWCLSMICGGALALTGVFLPSWSSVARLGMVLVAICCAFYGLDMFLIYGLQGVPTGLMFLGLAAAKCIRLAVSTAIRARLLHLPYYRDAGPDLTPIDPLDTP